MGSSRPSGRHGLPILSQRRLGRALLARQHLLERTAMPARAMVEHLVGMQAQVPQQPYVALWSRLADFEPTELERLVLGREVVRMTLMRTTIHLVSAGDAAPLRRVMAPVLGRALGSNRAWREQLEGLDLASVAAAGASLMEERPYSTADLSMHLAERWPGRDGLALALAVRHLVPMVQVPPRGLWTRSGLPRWVALGSWLGERAAAPPEAARRGLLGEVVRRYLGAFGPATVSDIQTWSWLTGLREIVDELRPGLLTFRDEAGRERFDLPDAPRPGEDVPAPPRLLPEYDNVLLSHRDRSHVIPPEFAPRLTGFVGRFLVDGRVHGQWRVKVDARGARLVLEPFGPLAHVEASALLEEAQRYLAWHAPALERRSVELVSAG